MSPERLDRADPSVPAPLSVGGISNFCWMEPGVLARGQQPPLEAATFAALRELGIRTILSLRPDREPPPTVTVRRWPEYHVEDEQALVEQAGLRFRHAPLEDFAAPSPAEMAAALAEVDAGVADAPAVYVHCRAGAGRAALVAGAWSISRGRSGDYAAAVYERFMLYIGPTIELASAERPAMYRRVGQPHVLWALREIARALGSPITSTATSLLPPERPPGADGWEQGYWETLTPWRERRRNGADLT